MEIRLFATFRDICGAKSINVPFDDGKTIGAILDDVFVQFPTMKEELFDENNHLRPHVHVFVNGKNIIHLDGLKTKVNTDDQLALFPPVAGG
ncbi:ubiquitin-like small modifier protein 1 [Texcoconibacillus texcoconensis]|uniref:Molybdopterin synthase sulfur carrier subunit n=1 Tax=Texcoconibacillus texcoconensis TaxID=1095777 RepID=A0A840QQ71_9BACI|nr:ubiquitin-like small modifier protein 1 [Texcoconibacillus texcoconensis]MBB5173488.1 molybdopterin synthase sulfur carrier subunit [Texcoconibacillus texcoconensis]